VLPSPAGLPALAVLLLAGTPPLAEAVATPLKDQYGRIDRLASHRGRPVVVMVVTAARLRSLKGWEIELRRRVGEGVGFLRVMDVPERPRVSHEDVARRLRERVPREVAVLIDLQRVWARAFRLDAREVNLLVFDGEGRLRQSFFGRRTPELVARVAEAAAAAR
jgi:hypothetical protein